jgi:MATE family multidrug resistance protein
MIYSVFGNWVVSAPLIGVITIWFNMGAIGIWMAMALGTVVYSGLCILALRNLPAGGDVP